MSSNDVVRDDFVNELDKDEAAKLLIEWRWLTAGRSLRPICMTAFGDWFLEDRASGAVLFLDASAGWLQEIAPSRAAWREHMRRRSKDRERRLRRGLRRALRAAGRRRAPGTTYCYVRRPSERRGPDLAALEPRPIRVHQVFLARLHRDACLHGRQAELGRAWPETLAAVEAEHAKTRVRISWGLPAAVAVALFAVSQLLF